MIARGRKSRAGITLVESLLAATVLAMAVSAIIVPFSAGAKSIQEDARQTLAVGLAQDLMEEILAKPFSDPDGSDADEEGRWHWDDMADYDALVEADGEIRSFDTQLVTEPASRGMTRHAWVKSVYVSGQDTAEPSSFLRVVVEVRYQDLSVIKLTRLVYANEGVPPDGDGD